jgi:hypothetical protein
MIPTSNQDGRQAKNRIKGDDGGGHLGRRAETPGTFLEENHPMTISLTLKLKKKYSPPKLLSLSQPNFAEMIIGWPPSNIVSDISDLRPRWQPQPNLI